jgi:hypothetical protein
MTLCKKNIALAKDLVDNPRKYEYRMEYILQRCAAILFLVDYQKK